MQPYPISGVGNELLFLNTRRKQLRKETFHKKEEEFVLALAIVRNN